MADVLSQDEIDALLAGLSSGEIDADDGIVVERAKGGGGVDRRVGIACGHGRLLGDAAAGAGGQAQREQGDYTNSDDTLCKGSHFFAPF